METLQSPGLPEILLSPAFLGLIGLCVGSFLNVVIYRLPVIMQREWLKEIANQLDDAEEVRKHTGLDEAQVRRLADASKPMGEALAALPKFSLSRPASRCPHCGHVLRWHENLPVIGWMLLGGKCASCKAGISMRYPFVELLTGVLFAAIAWQLGDRPMTLLYCGFAAALVALAGIDWDTTLLPDQINQPLLWIGLGAAFLGWTPISPKSAMIGVAVGYLSLAVIARAYEFIRQIEDAMGNGDFKLLAAMGAWLGWEMLIPMALIASVIGAAVGLYLKFSGGLREGVYVPFGPFLAGGAITVLLIGPGRIAGWLMLPA